MHLFEKICISIRHFGPFKRLEWLWDGVRPFYERAISVLGRNGLERKINNLDNILVLPELRSYAPEIYEQGSWKHMMSQVRSGDVTADVGAYIGLYTIALAKRVGPFGKVFAFEPHSKNFEILQAQIKLNNIENRVELIQKAVCAKNDLTPFELLDNTSHITFTQNDRTVMVNGITLDSIFADRRLDILKIDVEGGEEQVLKGAVNLLCDRTRCPRAMYIDVHPFVWPCMGTTDESLLDFLTEKCDFEVIDSRGEPIKQISSQARIIAVKKCR